MYTELTRDDRLVANGEDRRCVVTTLVRTGWILGHGSTLHCRFPSDLGCCIGRFQRPMHLALIASYRGLALSGSGPPYKAWP